MTEVDVVLPEGVAEPTTKLASASSSPKQSKPSADDVEQQVTTVEDDEEQVVEEQQEEDVHLPEAPSNEKLELLSAGGKDISKEDVAQASPQAPVADEIMEVDGTEDVEENEVENDDEDSQITSSSSKEPKLDEEDEEATTNGDGDHEPEDEDDAQKIGSTAENSCEAEDPLGAVTVPDDELASGKKAHLDGEESVASEGVVEEEPPAKQENGFGASPNQKEIGRAHV